jgi:hypothetical protein
MRLVCSRRTTHDQNVALTRQYQTGVKIWRIGLGDRDVGNLHAHRGSARLRRPTVPFRYRRALPLTERQSANDYLPRRRNEPVRLGKRRSSNKIFAMATSSTSSASVRGEVTTILVFGRNEIIWSGPALKQAVDFEIGKASISALKRRHGRCCDGANGSSMGSNQVFAHSRIAAIEHPHTLFAGGDDWASDLPQEDVNWQDGRVHKCCPYLRPAPFKSSATLIVDRRRAFLACPSQKRHPSIYKLDCFSNFPSKPLGPKRRPSCYGSVIGAVDRLGRPSTGLTDPYRARSFGDISPYLRALIPMPQREVVSMTITRRERRFAETTAATTLLARGAPPNHPIYHEPVLSGPAVDPGSSFMKYRIYSTIEQVAPAARAEDQYFPAAAICCSPISPITGS